VEAVQASSTAEFPINARGSQDTQRIFVVKKRPVNYKNKDCFMVILQDVTSSRQSEKMRRN
jgi:hypothetical protein